MQPEFRKRHILENECKTCFDQCVKMLTFTNPNGIAPCCKDGVFEFHLENNTNLSNNPKSKTRTGKTLLSAIASSLQKTLPKSF